MRDKKLNNRKISSFCRELAVLIHAGVGVSDGLHLMISDEASDIHGEWITAMAKKMDGGISLSDAMGGAKVFPNYVTGLVEVGEKTGRMEESLTALADYYEKRDRTERRLQSALTYPAVLLVLMLIVITVLLTRVLPVFNSVYSSLGAELTGAAGFLLKFGRVLDAILPFLCVLLILACLFLAVFSLADGFRERVLSFWRRRWGDRGVSRKINDAHLAQAIAMGLSSGLPVREALELASNLTSDIPEAAARCRNCTSRLEASGDLTFAIRESALLPASACRLLVLGNKSGTADTVMARLADRLSQDADEELERMVARVEPALVIVTSLLVGAILLSVMIPLMNIMTVIG